MALFLIFQVADKQKVPAKPTHIYNLLGSREHLREIYTYCYSVIVTGPVFFSADQGGGFSSISINYHIF